MWKYWMIALLIGTVSIPFVAPRCGGADLRPVNDELAGKLTGGASCDLISQQSTWCGGCLYITCTWGCGYVTTGQDFGPNPTMVGTATSCGNSFWCASYPANVKNCGGG